MAHTRNVGMNVEVGDKTITEILKEINVSAFLDKWGPAHVLQVYDPDITMHGVLVIDNTTLGPSCGGITISPTITPFQVFQHARAMTWTCALANVKLGGAAAGIRATSTEEDKTKFIRSFAKEVSPYVPDEYIAAPGLNMNQDEMAIFAEEVQDRRGSTGKPENMGGIPYELGVVGLGMAIAIETLIDVAKPRLWPQVNEARVAIHGFDSIGFTVAKYLANNGTKVVALCDDQCTIYEPNGIDVEKVHRSSLAINEKYSLKHCKHGRKLPRDDITKADCDIFVAATGNRVVTNETLPNLKAKCVIEGMNSPIAIEDSLFEERGITVLPNILATAGGAISSYAEYQGYSREMAFSLIASRIREITKEVLQRSFESGISPRRIAKEMAQERIMRTKEEGK